MGRICLGWRRAGDGASPRQPAARLAIRRAKKSPAEAGLIRSATHADCFEHWPPVRAAHLHALHVAHGFAHVMVARLRAVPVLHVLQAGARGD